MMDTEERAARRLQHSSAEAHIDALHHPDPCGMRLMALLVAIEKQSGEEGKSAAAYARLARATHDVEVATLMRVLADDHERRLRLLRQMGSALRDRLNWVTPADEPCPGDEWLQVVRGLEQDERRGSLALRNLASQARAEGDTLARLLLECMATDGDQHALLLKFVGRRRLSSQQP